LHLTEREKEIIELIKKDPTNTRESLSRELDISVSAVGTHIHNLTVKGYLLGRGYLLAPAKQIVVIGGSNLDIKGYIKNNFRDGTSNPGIIYESMGGVGRNVAENIAYLGEQVVLLTAVGQDHYGDKIIEETEQPSLDLSHILRSSQYRTGIYMAYLDETGDLKGAISDMKILNEINRNYLHRHRRIIENSSIIFFDANLKEDTIAYLLELAENSQILTVADPVSIEKSKRLVPFLDKIKIITPNLSEAGVLMQCDSQKQLSVSDDSELKTVMEFLERHYQNSKQNSLFIISAGSFGAFIIEKGKIKHIPCQVVNKDKVIETTGAGDSLTAGIIAGLVNSLSVQESVKQAMQVAALTIQSERTVNPDIQKINFKKANEE